MTAAAESARSASADELEIVTFQVDDALMGIPITQVEEINHHLDLTDVPHAPACVRGVTNLRGDVVTVLDLRVVLGLSPTTINRRSCNVVVRYRDERIGLLVDGVGDVVRTPSSAIERPPANAAGDNGQFFRGVCKLVDRLLVVLNTEHVLATEVHSAS